MLFSSCVLPTEGSRADAVYLRTEGAYLNCPSQPADSLVLDARGRGTWSTSFPSGVGWNPCDDTWTSVSARVQLHVSAGASFLDAWWPNRNGVLGSVFEVRYRAWIEGPMLRLQAVDGSDVLRFDRR